MGDSTTHHGDQDIREQRSTYAFFMGLTKWGSLAIGVLLLFLVIWFCTPAGFGPALGAALVLLVAGIVGLRSAGAH